MKKENEEICENCGKPKSKHHKGYCYEFVQTKNFNINGSGKATNKPKQFKLKK